MSTGAERSSNATFAYSTKSKLSSTFLAGCASVSSFNDVASLLVLFCQSDLSLLTLYTWYRVSPLVFSHVSPPLFQMKYFYVIFGILLKYPLPPLMFWQRSWCVTPTGGDSRRWHLVTWVASPRYGGDCLCHMLLFVERLLVHSASYWYVSCNLPHLHHLLSTERHLTLML